MKKLFLLLSFIPLVLTGCNSQEKEKATDSPKETVQLTAKNFSTYVAINSSSTSVGNDSKVRYYTYFIGADYCKFIDCKVSYIYRHATTPSSDSNEQTTISLSISGDGEAAFFLTGGLYYYCEVVSASGTVLVYR